MQNFAKHRFFKLLIIIRIMEKIKPKKTYIYEVPIIQRGCFSGPDYRGEFRALNYDYDKGTVCIEVNFRGHNKLSKQKNAVRIRC